MFSQEAAELKLGSVALFLLALAFLVWEMGVGEGVVPPGSAPQRE